MRTLARTSCLVMIGIFLMSALGRPVSSQQSHNRMRDAIEVLMHVPSGKALLQRAQDYWGFRRTSDLMSVLRWGKASKTDAVLTRHYNPATGKEQRERKVLIYLREDQPLEDLILDISHELIHAT